MSAGDRTLEMPREAEFRRPERVERTNDRFERPERTNDRFERPERNDRFERPERPAAVRPERFERAPMPDRDMHSPPRADRDVDFVHPSGPPVHLPADPGMVRLFLSAGRRNAVTPSMVVAALANSSGIDGRDIGRIEVHDRNTFVDVRQEVAHAVLAVEQLAMGNRLAVIKVARPDSDTDHPSAPPMRARPGAFSSSQRPTWGAKPAPVTHRKGPSRPKR
jgi:ATP-dependent RNA helicase DeaD